jgi:pilus assembly protein CpaB
VGSSMNWKTWTPIILAAALGLVAAKVGRDMVLRMRGNNVAAPKLVQVVVASQDLPPGTALTEGHLQFAPMLPESLPRNPFTDPAVLVGRVVVLPMAKGQLVLEHLLAPTGTGRGPQALVPVGMRAITVEVNEFSGLAGMLMPGCRVDVVSTLQDRKHERAVAKTIVSNVRVIAVGRRTSTVAADDEEASASKSVTLLVTPREAEAIDLASNAGGKTRLVLRGTLDETTVATSGVTAAQLLEGMADNERPPVQPVAVVTPQPTTQPVKPVAAVAVKQPRVRTVEVIRSGAVTKVNVPIDEPASAITDGNADVREAIPGATSP